MMRHCQCFLLTLLMILTSTLVFADSTPNIPIEDPAYQEIDLLIAHGLVGEVVIGQRPWSRSEFSRIVHKAAENREDENAYVDHVLKRLQKRFPAERPSFHVSPLETFRVEYDYLDSPWRAVPRENGIGTINAEINPLVANRGARHYVHGSNYSYETEHSAQLSRYASLYTRPRFEALFDKNTGDDFSKLIPQNLYTKLAFGNFEVQVGRDELIWGQAQNGGFAFTNNARPLDMVKLTSTAPFHLPWICRHFGHSRITLFAAHLGPEGAHPNAVLSGYKWSFQPLRFLELGLSHTVMMGGTGADSPDFLEAIGEFSGIPSALAGNKRFNVTTNRFFSAEMRITMPFLRYTQFYLEMGFDDTLTDLAILLEDNAAYHAGIYLPRLNNTGSLKLTINYKRLPAEFYHHGFYTDGLTLNRKIIGAVEGPDSDTLFLGVTYDVNGALLDFGFQWMRRDSDRFATTTVDGNILDIFVTQNNPAEWSYLPSFGIRVPWEDGQLTFKLDVGLEFTHNTNFQVGQNDTNFLAGLAITKKWGL